MPLRRRRKNKYSLPRSTADSLKACLVNAVISFYMGGEWRQVLRRATLSRPAGKERKFLLHTSEMSEDGFGNVADLVAQSGGYS